ncbi:unnamed protein product [Ectocarpus sp. CCAP 1310/34]|nr:unnamed protein product [Ectocarpus sp. CCAP 1310/34]
MLSRQFASGSILEPNFFPEPQQVCPLENCCHECLLLAPFTSCCDCSMGMKPAPFDS